MAGHYRDSLVTALEASTLFAADTDLEHAFVGSRRDDGTLLRTDKDDANKASLWVHSPFFCNDSFSLS
jgi:hypothetical protein